MIVYHGFCAAVLAFAVVFFMNCNFDVMNGQPHVAPDPEKCVRCIEAMSTSC